MKNKLKTLVAITVDDTRCYMTQILPLVCGQIPKIHLEVFPLAPKTLNF